MKPYLLLCACILFLSLSFSGCGDSTSPEYGESDIANITIPDVNNCTTEGVIVLDSDSIEPYLYDGEIHGIKVKVEPNKWFVMTRDGDISDGNLNDSGMYDVSVYPYNIKFGLFDEDDFESDGHVDADAAEFKYYAHKGQLEITEVTPNFSGRCSRKDLRSESNKKLGGSLSCGWSTEFSK